MVHGLRCRGMWDLPGLGIEPVSPVLAGRFFTTGPPGKSLALPDLARVGPSVVTAAALEMELQSAHQKASHHTFLFP